MAKDMVFESERYSRRQSSKRFVVPAIAFALVLAVAVVYALFLRGSRTERFTGGEDTPYPYAWEVSRDGVISLEVDSSAAQGYAFAVSEETDLGGELSPIYTLQTNGRQSNGKEAFILTPQASGRAALVLDLVNDAQPDDAIYRMTLIVNALEENGAFSGELLSVTGAELQGAQYGGEGTAHPYSIYRSESGDLLITVQRTETADDEMWFCVSDREEVVDVLGVLDEADGGATAYLRAGTETGSCTVTLLSEDAGVQITAECERREDGTIYVLSHAIGEYAAPTAQNG